MTAGPAALTASRIAGMVGGEVAGDGEATVLRGRADSRLCRPGDLYVALPGEHVDGHRFISAAWDAGAVAALAARDAEVPRPPEGKALILVADPLASLQDAARELRGRQSGLKVVGVTGSNGKTTTKEILAAILRRTFGDSLLVSEGNYNSDIGLPLTLLGLRPVHRAAVLEMGMNRPGEMALLASIARPGVAVVTNIGTAHVGMVGSREKLAAEKRSVFDGAGPESVAVVGAREPWADFLLESYPGEVRRFGQWGRGGWESFQDKALEGFVLRRYGRDVSFALPGAHNLLNAMAAVEAASAMGASEDDIAAGIEAVRPISGRTEIVHGAVTMIRDGYNANPESLGAAFELFSGIAVQGRRILVLGEMLELGDETDAALSEAGGAAADLRPDAIFLFGGSLEILKASALGAGFRGRMELHESMDALRESLAGYLQPGDLVLLKGSRGSALERLDDILTGGDSG